MAKVNLLAYLERYSSTDSPTGKMAAHNELRDKFFKDVKLVEYIRTIKVEDVENGKIVKRSAVIKGAFMANILYDVVQQIDNHTLINYTPAQYHNDLKYTISDL